MATDSPVLYADFTCPFSYVTEAALGRVLPADRSTIDYRAFELFPAPAPLPATPIDDSLLQALLPLAAEAGVHLTAPRFVPRTRKAHEAACFARRHGAEAALRRAVYQAYWEAGRDIGRIDVLCSLAGAAGLVAEEMKIALDIDACAEEVALERAAAERAGVHQTPTLIVGGTGAPRVMVGAHPVSDLRAMLGDGGENV
jgi:predicted DsbA family dithiol-disulfide isomerase